MEKESRGFAGMSLEKRREIASKGGRAAHTKGKAYKWTSEEARKAGRKGGMASHRRKQGLTSQSLEEFLATEAEPITGTVPFPADDDVVWGK